MYFVSRQKYWPDGRCVVEIANGGLDYANPDMLNPKFNGEGREYIDPREALMVARQIAKEWKNSNPKLEIEIGAGCTGGFTLPFDGKDNEELDKWAETQYNNLKKCDHCGDVIDNNNKNKQFIIQDLEDCVFCSENCAEIYYYNYIENNDDE